MTGKKKDIVAPEWSYPVRVDEIVGRLKLRISPQDSDRARLVQRLGLLSLDELEADVALARESGQMKVHVTGQLRARLRQSCVVTLDPVEDEIEENFEAWFADPDLAVTLAKVKHDRLVKKGRVEVPLLDELDDPEPIFDGKIDIGELVVQFLSLAINPFPQAKGVSSEEGEAPVRASVGETSNPFAALKDWKVRQGREDN